MINGVIGILIGTDNLDRLSAFYRDTLGLTPHSIKPHIVSFAWEGMRLSIVPHSQVKGQARDPHRVMVNLGVADIHTTHARLAAKGVHFIRKPGQEKWGGWIATFTDPDGNILQLMQLS
jgi:predicted enzyme related to lactoylglutathione lyase